MTPINVQYAVKGYNKELKSWVVRSAEDKESASKLAHIFMEAPELTHVSFGWEGAFPVVEEIGDIPQSILEKYFSEIVIES